MLSTWNSSAKPKVYNWQANSHLTSSKWNNEYKISTKTSYESIKSVYELRKCQMILCDQWGKTIVLY